MFKRILLVMLVFIVVVPATARAIPFGGAIGLYLRCYNQAIFTVLGPPRGGQYIWSPATRTYQFGPPRGVGQWLLGLASAPYYCVYSIFPVLVAPGIHMDMMGSSGAPAQISLGTALTQGTPPPSAPPAPPPATCPGSPGPTNCGAGTGVGHVLVSEVYAMVDGTHGTDPTNEWIEVYNGTGSTVNFSGWRMTWGTGTTTLPTASLGAGQILVFSPSTTTRTHWNIPSTVQVVAVAGASNMTENGAVRLIDPNGVVIDAVSWGSDTSAFSPAAPALRVGHSLVRTTVLVDNNSAADWSDRSSPSPGN